MDYYSHVLHFPNTHPFDKEEYRWPSFVGAFVVPIVSLGLHKHYWCSYYTESAKLRIFTDQYDEIERHIIRIRDNLGLVDKGEEKDLTFSADLCGHRYSEENLSNPARENRGLLVLRYLHSVCDLYSDLLIKLPDGYWMAEKSTDGQNLGDNCLVSCMHLLGNIGHFQFPLEVTVRTPWMPQPLGCAFPIHV
jgi:hypothetical protein